MFDKIYAFADNCIKLNNNAVYKMYLHICCVPKCFDIKFKKKS